jgi:hypothetical protein
MGVDLGDMPPKAQAWSNQVGNPPPYRKKKDKLPKSVLGFILLNKFT